MQTREAKLHDEATALWRELCGEPPPNGVDGATLLGILIGHARDVGYDRLASPHLRDTTLSRPSQGRDPGPHAKGP